MLLPCCSQELDASPKNIWVKQKQKKWVDGHDFKDLGNLKMEIIAKYYVFVGLVATANNGY